MVYIKRIDLRGFKTFGKKVTLRFERGLTVITGPNGSGKSNILDSVRFSLGELSPKEMRVGTISDLIHKGTYDTSSRSAYVAVQFDNQDRRIPVDSDNVTVSREFQKTGEGVYRLNGRRVSRKQLTDILSSGDIQVGGYNIVPQHAITRFAETNPEERRKIIEDIVGIAIYDVKKAEAQMQLQGADLNLKVASAKIDGVRVRVESLEKERNDYLRSQQLSDQIKVTKGSLVALEIQDLEITRGRISFAISEKQKELEQLKQEKDKLQKERNALEEEQQRFERETVQKGDDELFGVERTIGDINARMASTTARIEQMQAGLRDSGKQLTQLTENLEKLESTVNQHRHEYRLGESTLAKTSKQLSEKQLSHDELSSNVKSLRENLGERNREAEILEQRIHEISRRLVKFSAQVKASSTKIDLLESHLKTLVKRREDYRSLVSQLEQRIEELTKLLQQEKIGLDNTIKKIDELTRIIEQRKLEMKNAVTTAREARLILVELEAQRDIVESIGVEDKSLELLQEMATNGALEGVYGKFGDLVKFPLEYSKAIEAASAGWLKALVVKDVQTALKCAELLKRTKSGRVKIIPLDRAAEANELDSPTDLDGIRGPLSDYVESSEEIRPAVTFVFGDTLLASEQKLAFFATLRNMRAVHVSGDLYEPQGGIEGGFYRKPMDLSKVIPKDTTIKRLDSTVDSLESLVDKARLEVHRLQRDIIYLSENRARSIYLIENMRRESEQLTSSVERYKKSIPEIAERIFRVTQVIETENVILGAAAKGRGRLQEKLSQFARERASLRVKAKSAALIEAEQRLQTIVQELNSLAQNRADISSRITALESAISTLQPSLQQIRVQIRSLKSHEEKLVSEVNESEQQKSALESELKTVARFKQDLSDKYTSVRGRRAEFHSRLSKNEKLIGKLLDATEPVAAEISQLNTKIRELELQIEFRRNELKEMGFEHPPQISQDQPQGLQDTLRIFEKELREIGSVNQLAVQQYDEVKENYKHLASRINELEKEKVAILNFMAELDRTKRETFMSAFNEVNSNFSQIFAKVTGGEGSLVLETPRDPFAGGVDLYLMFPGKINMTISSASGGEKSVGTVCFLLALHAIHPMPFYIMDEIDAHLDGLNSQRLADLLKERSRGSQFIVVSLKDVTISHARSVYGAFVQNGVSQVVALPRPELKARG